jgi:uncharacterized protein YqeY
MEIDSTTMGRGDCENLRDRLRGALPRAMRMRDAVAVAALRSALSALDNAEAVDPVRAPPPSPGHADLAGTVAGLGAAEVERRSLTESQMEEIVRGEVAERHAVACDYEHAGRPEHAERLRAEAKVLGAYLGDMPSQ